MSANVFITIDTEEDLWDKWRDKDNPIENVARIPALQDLFDRFGAVPTYLVNYPVVVNRDSCSILMKLYDKQCCEIGLHIHPWNTPPYDNDITAENTMICNLPYKVIYNKIQTIHSLIKDRLGLAPKSFRAGRWAFSSDVARCIFDLGYTIDTSITPFIDWRDEKGPDFGSAHPFPYRFSPSNILDLDPEGRILEVPPTIGFLQHNFDQCARLRRRIMKSPLSNCHLLGILDRLRILNFRKLSPEVSSGPDMIRLAQTFIKRGASQLNLFFHSSSLLAGNTPYVRTDQDLKAFLSRIEMFLRFVADSGMTFSTLSAAIEDMPKKQQVAQQTS